MKMASKYDCGNEKDAPQNSVNLMNIYRKYIGPESVTSLDNCSLPFSAQQLQQKKKLSTTQKPSVYRRHILFSRLFSRCHEMRLGKAITNIENRITKSEGHRKLFAALLCLHGNQALKDSSKFKTSH